MIFFKGGCPELHLVLFNESMKINVLGLSLMQSSLIFNPSVLSIKTFWKNSTTVEKKRIVLPELLWKHHVQLCYNLLKHDIASNITPASMHPPASRVWSQVTASKVLLLYIYKYWSWVRMFLWSKKCECWNGKFDTKVIFRCAEEIFHFDTQLIERNSTRI